MFDCKSYVFDVLFKLTLIVVKSKICKVNYFAHFLKSSNLRHCGLRHVSYDTLHRLLNLNGIPMFYIDSKYTKLMLRQN